MSMDLLPPKMQRVSFVLWEDRSEDTITEEVLSVRESSCDLELQTFGRTLRIKIMQKFKSLRNEKTRYKNVITPTFPNINL